MRLMISFAALFLSVVLLQISTGGVGPLDALSGFALNFSSTEIGLLGSAHFFGFFIGCWYAPRIMGTKFKCSGRRHRANRTHANNKPLCLGYYEDSVRFVRCRLLHCD